MPQRLTYSLTPALLAATVGAGVLCLSASAEGRAYRLHAERPGPGSNRYMRRAGSGVIVTADRAEGPTVYGPQSNGELPPAEVLVRVDISGPIEQRAGYHDPCGAWTDGNDAIAERLCAAFAEGDVLLVIDSPGGANAGAAQGIGRAQAAKAKYGRRCTVFGDELVASLGLMWALAMGDNVYGPAASQWGSIGARGGHLSTAGAMAHDGLEMTYFTWPDAGKVAFAPEFPLSPEGRRRGERDVAEAGEAFCALVVGSTLGLRYGLTRESVMSLSADVFTGSAALTCPDAAGDARACLIDGVESLETVVAYALTLAESDEAKAIESAGAASAVRAAAQLRASARTPRRATR